MNARAATVLFAAAAFFGAGMLFLVQPMIARLLLPSYGGSATVWSTASLFFQMVLLLGYLYTHRVTKLRPRRLRWVHAVVLLTPLLVLPLALPDNATPAPGVSPVLWLLRTLTLVIGLPFLVLATTGPLVQRWYSWSGMGRSEDPYFLFAASNLGSFVGLLSYPFLIEPHLTLDAQLRLWSIGFGLFILLTGACLLVRPRAAGAPVVRSLAEVPAEPADRLPVRRVLRWVGWAFLPSGLMLAVTAHISTDIAAIPLLWVVPLAIYLATFVVAFARVSRRPPVLVTRIAVLAAVIAAMSAVVNVEHQPVVVAILIQMVMLALVAFASHARLAADRPETSQLTKFYLVVAIGGALGGLLNGVIAPLVFDRVIEYALLIVTVPLLLVGLKVSPAEVSDERRSRRRVRTRILAAAVLVLVPAAAIAVASPDSRGVVLGLALLGATILAWALTETPRLLCMALVVLQVGVLVAQDVDVIDRRRTFYGSYSLKATDGLHKFYAGTTLHGTQFVDGRRTEPTSYYARSGPLGDVFALRDFRNVAAVGLGAGTVAAYGTPGESMTFYEIDQAVVDIARDPHLFTYLADSAAHVKVVVGDGRLGLEAAPKGSFDLILLDAFSSDAIPVHLLTAEAVRVYADRLQPGGLLAFHISNNTFDFRPVIRGLADSLGWVGLVGTGQGSDPGATPSTWVVLAATPADFGDLAQRPGWQPLPPRSVAWTDNYSSVLGVLR